MVSGQALSADSNGACMSGPHMIDAVSSQVDLGQHFFGRLVQYLAFFREYPLIFCAVEYFNAQSFFDIPKLVAHSRLRQKKLVQRLRNPFLIRHRLY